MREIGIRMTLGATMAGVIRQLVSESMRPVMAGLACGLAAALAGSRVLSAGLYGVSARDPLAVAVSVAILTATAAIAVIVPASRAARVDPATVLRDS